MKRYYDLKIKGGRNVRDVRDSRDGKLIRHRLVHGGIPSFAHCLAALCLLAILASLAAPARGQAAKSPDSVTSASDAAEQSTPIGGTGPYGVDVTAGYAAYQADLKVGVWFPVWATVEARKADLEGEIQIQQPNNQLLVTIPIQVAKGTRKRYQSYYQLSSTANAFTLNITIRLKRMKGENFPVPIRIADDSEQHILALTDEAGSLGALNRLGLDTFQEPTSNNPQTQGQGVQPRRIQTNTALLGGTKVIYGDPDRLPENPIALDAIDGMVISTRRVRSLNKRQWEAIGAWVARGGRLILAGGKHQPFIEQSVAKNAFGITLAPAQPSSMAGIFGPDAAESLLASWPAGGWTRLALGDAQHPLIAGKQVGRGWFYVCAVALDSEMMKLMSRRDNAGRLWPELLECHQSGTPLEQVAEEDAQLIGADLQRPFSVNLAGTGWVLGFLGIYILLVLPVNWFICGRLKRREWAWPVAIAIALAFTWYGYSSGLRSQSNVFQVNEVAFVMQSAGEPLARGVTFSTLFSPRRYRTDLQGPGGVFANAPSRGRQNQYQIYIDQMDLYSDRNMAFVFSPASVWMGDFFFHPWSARNLRSDFTLPISGGVEVQKPLTLDQMNTNAPAGIIVNRSPWRFKRWWIANGNKVWAGRTPLEKKTSATLERDLAQLGSVAYDQSLPSHISSIANSNLTCGADIVRDAMTREFFKPQDYSLGPNRQLQYHSSMQSNIPREAWLTPEMQNSSSTELFFIGEAETATIPSPLLESLKLDKRVGILLYEAALPLGGQVAQSGRNPSRWKLAPLNRTTMENDGYHSQIPTNINANDRGEMIIRAESTDVQLMPDVPVNVGLDGPLTVALKVENYPDKDLNFIAVKDRTGNAERDQITGIPQNSSSARQNAQAPKEYNIAGCPVMIYNLRQRRLEKTSLPEQGTFTVTPARDYLMPGSSAVVLRVEGDLPALIFRKKQDGQSLLNARDIIGPQVESLTQNSNFSGNSSNRFSFLLRIKDISVTLGDAKTTSTLERRAQ